MEGQHPSSDHGGGESNLSENEMGINEVICGPCVTTNNEKNKFRKDDRRNAFNHENNSCIYGVINENNHVQSGRGKQKVDEIGGNSNSHTHALPISITTRQVPNEIKRVSRAEVSNDACAGLNSDKASDVAFYEPYKKILKGNTATTQNKALNSCLGGRKWKRLARKIYEGRAHGSLALGELRNFMKGKLVMGLSVGNMEKW